MVKWPFRFHSFSDVRHHCNYSIQVTRACSFDYERGLLLLKKYNAALAFTNWFTVDFRHLTSFLLSLRGALTRNSGFNK